MEDKKAEIIEEAQPDQDSPTDEQKQTEEETKDEESRTESEDDKSVEQERNWKALREENERLKKMVDRDSEVQPKESPLADIKQSPAISFYLNSEVQSRLLMDELRAEIQVPQLETDPLFAETVAGKYRREIDAYVTALSRGADQRTTPLPSASKIAKKTQDEWNRRFGTEVKKAESEGARKAKVSLDERRATSEAEGRSDRATKVQTEAELAILRRKSQEGDPTAIMERLSRIRR